MKILAFWDVKHNSPSNVSYVLSGIQSKFGLAVENYDPDTVEGANACSRYSVSSFPTIIALANTGMVLQTWRGGLYPSLDEIQYYVDRNQ